MSRASSVVASVTQQSRQRVPQSRTEYRERMSSDGTTAWRANDHMPCQRLERNRQLDTEAWYQQWVKTMDDMLCCLWAADNRSTAW